MSTAQWTIVFLVLAIIFIELEASGKTKFVTQIKNFLNLSFTSAGQQPIQGSN
jgi:hypothetical protein